MPDDESPRVWIVPTEMGRHDVAWEMFAILFAALVVYWWSSVPMLREFSVWPAIFPLGLLGVWILTGEGAADLPFVGAIAGPLRARIGHRRVHEWAVVYAHYVRVGLHPRFVYASNVHSRRVGHATRVKAGAGWRRLRSIRVRTSS